MSRRDHQAVRAWTTEHVQDVLARHGLAECCETVGKRAVDGDTLLNLTEGRLALWKCDLSLAIIKKLSRFVQDVKDHPEKYIHADSVPSVPASALGPRAVSNNGVQNLQAVKLNNTPDPHTVSYNSVANSQAVHLNTSDHHIINHSNKPDLNQNSTYESQCSVHSGKSSPISDEWDTDFSDDQDSSKVPNKKSSGPEEEEQTEYMNQMAPPEKPPVPTRPPILAPKPMLPPSLPKPPVLQENACFGHVKTIIDNLKLLDNQFDDEEYESFDGEAIDTLKQSLASQMQPTQNTAPVTEAPKHSITSITKEPTTDGNLSDEYESIRDTEKPRDILPGEGTEYYLQPVQQQSAEQTGGAPTLPAKAWRKPPDATLPSTKPPSPPQRKSDDSSSPGNSGDGVTGLLGEFLRKFRGPDTKERTPTPEVKKAATLPTPSHKTFQSNQRPLPPTPDGSTGSRRGSRVGLTQQPWYHDVDRRKAEEMLRNGEDGCFLVRPSSQTNNPLTLTLWYNRRLYNISIRHRPDGRYALGTEKANEQSFVSVEELVQNYQSEKLVLFTGGERTGRTLLTTSPSQSHQFDVALA